MSTSHSPLNDHHNITPPSGPVNAPLTPPHTDKRTFTQAARVIALFKDIEAGRHAELQPWTEFQLARGEYDEIEYQLSRDDTLHGFAKNKLRYDYDGNRYQLIVRMPTSIHERFIDRVEDAIRDQLKAIREGIDRAALFANKVHPTRSTDIFFPREDDSPGPEPKHSPDASFWHDDAKYPGVVIEVAYSQKRKKLSRLAEDYLLDSDDNIRVVVGLDIEYGKKGSRMATLSVWRTQVFHTAEGDELRVVQEVADEKFRDDQGNNTNHPGLRLHLQDFAYKKLAQAEIGDQDKELVVSSQQLHQYLLAAEAKTPETFGEESIAPGLKKRKDRKHLQNG